jgi:SM-20-related protein
LEQNQINLSSLERMFEDLAQNGWAVSSQVFDPAFCQMLARECQKQHADGQFTKASIGRGVSKATHAEIRGDFTRWMTEDSTNPLEQDFLRALHDISQSLNQFFFLGLKRFETHFALYPPGAGYDKHVDNHRGTGARKITFILYLNENWQKDHGGALSVFDPNDENHQIAQVEPRLGNFVLFRSDLFPHQVEKSFQPRLSLTGWFRDDAS